jgi:hypothetical protein
MMAACGVTAVLAVLTLAMTWPLGAHLASSVPGGYGEPLQAIWAMSWVMRSLTTALAHPATLTGFWNAGIFVPEPHALAFSEPLIGESLLVLPLHWLGATPLACYNTAFLASWVLSGLGMFLLVRSLARHDRADSSPSRPATIAGITAALVIAFNPFRVAGAVNRLDEQSIQWLPFALLAVHRYLETDRRRALLLAALAAIALNLSSIDRLLYGSGLIVVFALVQIVRLQRWQARVWFELWAAGAGVLVVTLICALPYLEMQRLFGAAPRPVGLKVLAAAVLAIGVGLAAGKIASRWPRHGSIAIAVALCAYLGAMRAAPFPLDQPHVSGTLAAPPPTLALNRPSPPIYRELRALSSDALVVELPLGDPAYDLRYLFFAATHARRLMNGYGRVIPPSYRALQQVLLNPVLDPEQTRKAIAPATHVLVHRGAWPEAVGTEVAKQLAAMGGTVVARDGDDVLFQMQPPERVTAWQTP